MSPPLHRSAARVLLMLITGAAAGLITGALGFWEGAPVVGWIAASLVYCIRVWMHTRGLTPEQTAAKATTEDPSRPVADVLILLASLASIAAVAVLLVAARDQTGWASFGSSALALSSLTLSWILVHTLYMLRYASLYYGDEPGGIDFNQKERPRYSDFAYVAFTLGMTYQVADTSLQSSDMRSTALRHALLSYVFGAVILASTINLVAGLAN